jgi:CopG family nickel-responsive transcriptional regulator
MLYDHEARGLESALTHVQHQFANVICSSMHIHLSETDCLVAIAVKGNAAEVRKLRDQLATRKGVKLFKVMVFSL